MCSEDKPLIAPVQSSASATADHAGSGGASQQHAVVPATARFPTIEDPPHLYCSDFHILATQWRRFGLPPTAEAVSEQFRMRTVVLSEFAAEPKFDPSNELELEQWVDAIATRVTGAHLSVPIFIEVWASKSKPDVAAAIRKQHATTYEDLVDKVAIHIFPTSWETRRLEKWFFTPGRHLSVRAALRAVRSNCALYMRLCERRKRPPGLHNNLLLECFLQAIPRDVERQLRYLQKHRSVEEIMATADELASDPLPEMEERTAAPLA